MGFCSNCCGLPMLQLMTLSKPSFLLPSGVEHCSRSSSALIAISPRTAYSAFNTKGLTVFFVSTLSDSFRWYATPLLADVEALRLSPTLELAPMPGDWDRIAVRRPRQREPDKAARCIRCDRKVDSRTKSSRAASGNRTSRHESLPADVSRVIGRFTDRQLR